MRLPNTHAFVSADKRRCASYSPATLFLPEGLQDTKGTIYRLIRTVRTRRGFGTIIHTLTTFTTSKAKAHKSATYWVRRQTRER